MKKTFSKKIAKNFGSVERFNLSLRQVRHQSISSTQISPL
jgi:hypothetical protein